MFDAGMQEQIDRFNEGWQAVDKLYAEYAKAFGLTYIGLEVLETIHAAPEGCTQKDICALHHLPKQTVNTVIRDLWKEGYVVLQELDSDRRNKTVRLSEKGKQWADEVVGRLWDAQQKAMARLTSEQRQVLVESMEIFEKSLRENMQVQKGRHGLPE